MRLTVSATATTPGGFFAAPDDGPERLFAMPGAADRPLLPRVTDWSPCAQPVHRVGS